MTKVIAVIHHKDDGTSLRNAAVAAEAGCDGIMLIQMDGRDHELDGPALAAKARHPGLLVGLNRLCSDPWEAIPLDHALGLDATWSDFAHVTSRGADGGHALLLEALAKARLTNPSHRFFGGVAFKGGPAEPDPALAAATARDAGDMPWTITTSGTGTGTAPGADKLAAMAAVVGRDRLAVASGISPDNAASLARHVGTVLAATHVSADFHNLDPVRLASLVRICSGL